MTADDLAGLRDVHSPSLPWLWTVPDWVFVLVVLLLLASAAVLLHHRRRPMLRGALREIARLEHAYAEDRNANRLVRGLSRLLRRYAVARFPNAGVEGMTGSDWVQFLIAHGNGFDTNAAEALAVRPYQAGGEIDASLLAGQVRHWLKANPQ